jgi:hypothetical protein
MRRKDRLLTVRKGKRERLFDALRRPAGFFFLFLLMGANQPPLKLSFARHQQHSWLLQSMEINNQTSL